MANIDFNNVNKKQYKKIVKKMDKNKLYVKVEGIRNMDMYVSEGEMAVFLGYKETYKITLNENNHKLHNLKTLVETILFEKKSK